MTSDIGSVDRKQAAVLSIRSLSFLAMAVAAALVVSLAAPRGAEANPRYAGLVIDAVSGEVFYEENADAVIDKMIELARQETDPEVRRRAVYWLGRTGSDRAAAFLQEILREGSGWPTRPAN